MLGATIVSHDAVVAATHPSKLAATQAFVGFSMSEGLPIFRTITDYASVPQESALDLASGVKVRVCKAGTRQVLGRDVLEELHIGGTVVINGYQYGDNSSFYDDKDGHWLATGDQAKMTKDDVIYILGRLKDIIIRGGENLSLALIKHYLGKAGAMVLHLSCSLFLVTMLTPRAGASDWSP